MAASVRNHTFDLLCGLCILRMVWLHVMSNNNLHHLDWFEVVMQWSYYFMCFFFFKAGYFNKTMSGHTRTFCIDKIKRLFIPYMSWGVLGSVIFFTARWYVNDLYGKEFIKFKWAHLWSGGGFYGDPPLWFLLSFFFTYIIIHFIEKVPRLHFIVILFPPLSYWLYTIGNPMWFGINNVPMGIFFFYLGHAWHYAMQRMQRADIVALSLFLVALMFIVNHFCPGRYDMNANNWSGPWLSVWGVSVLAMCGLSGILLSLPQKRVPWVCFIGEHSMVFFVAHYVLINIYKYIHFSFKHWRTAQPDEAIIMFLAVICICSWLVPYVESIPLLSGRWKKTCTKE